MQNIIVHIMNKSWFTTDTFQLELQLFGEIYESDNIQNIIFYKGGEIQDTVFARKLKKIGAISKNYLNRDDIVQQVLELKQEYNILYVHTTIETTMNITNDLKEIIGQKSPINHKIFRDKFIQREMLQAYSPELGIRFMVGTINTLNYEEIRDTVGIPFILKPTNGVQSSGVVKICNRGEFVDYKESVKRFRKIFQEKGIIGDNLIAEEYIDGELYSIDYFVDEEGGIRLSEPIKERLGIDIGIEDYFVLSRITTNDTQNTFRYIHLDKFVKESVDAMGILNSFVHHEFKINTRGQLKTIEVNGRIGGGRHELMYKGFGINFFRFIIDSKQEYHGIIENVIGVNLFATTSGKLTGFNKKLFREIKKRESVYEIIKQENAIGKDIGLTKDGYVKVGTIKMAHANLDTLRRDYEFIERNYTKLLEIESNFISITNIVKIFSFDFKKKS